MARWSLVGRLSPQIDHIVLGSVPTPDCSCNFSPEHVHGSDVHSFNVHNPNVYRLESAYFNSDLAATSSCAAQL